ncbi:GNAT family N-acetyltransferase [Allokutzneria sp. A3M-2-11 16]|uniref:GNAT family N-acetyltransferase n=1 Tax=Allokutzneria sp. A3M-2-11 16 TaxID=2962043 RepID=UPI0020B89436|nr:GNAT family N-acetyltransferase [Allokutzneria sp. A3M-2-11 16]MCP3803230.1 GNAT family N-acetyltransferase [Allokutzneria sp. A3M-2-11 16]
MTSDELRLRLVEDSDTHRYGEIMLDPRTRHFNGRLQEVRLLPDGAAVIMRQREGEARGEKINWCIADRTTDRMVGHIQLFDLVGSNVTEAKVDYAVHPDSRGRGVLTEALQVVVTWAFRPRSEEGRANDASP